MDEVGFSYYKILRGNWSSDLLLDNVVCFVTFICAICLPGLCICLGFPIIAREKVWVWDATFFFSMEPLEFVFSSIINWYEINLCEHCIIISISFRISLSRGWYLKAAHSTQRYSSSIIIHAMQSCDT